MKIEEDIPLEIPGIRLGCYYSLEVGYRRLGRVEKLFSYPPMRGITNNSVLKIVKYGKYYRIFIKNSEKKEFLIFSCYGYLDKNYLIPANLGPGHEEESLAKTVEHSIETSGKSRVLKILPKRIIPNYH